MRAFGGTFEVAHPSETRMDTSSQAISYILPMKV